VINKTSSVGARMSNVIVNRLRSTKQILWWCGCYHDRWLPSSTPYKR
jgi:hypothetical protein